jgi:sugar O-acyltransferase (sialic acid O-acetyltransferase NeuD family)
MIYLIGAGGFAREVLNILIDLGLDKEVKGFLEDNCLKSGELLNGIELNDISVLDKQDRDKTKLVCAIGTPLRERLIKHTIKLGYTYKTLIHPSVIDSEWVDYKEGCVVCAGNILTSQISIDRYSIINLNCTIGHDVTIGKFSTISPGVNISGRVNIGDGCFIGSGAVIVERKSIGNGSFIGAGAVVTKDIPENVLAIGAPAKPVKELNKSDWSKLI